MVKLNIYSTSYMNIYIYQCVSFISVNFYSTCYQTVVLFIIFKRNIKWKTPAVMYVKTCIKYCLTCTRDKLLTPCLFDRNMLYMPPSNCKDKKSTSLTAGQIAFRYLTLIVALQMAKIKPMQLKSIAACLSVFF